MNTRLVPFGLAALIAAAGCVSSATTMLTPNRYEPVAPQDVHVFLDADEVPSGCVRVALIHASGNANWTNERQLIRAAQRKSAEAGGNAVLLRSMRDPSTGTRVAAAVFDGVPADRKAQMIAFRCPPETDALPDPETE
jgi:hypothetical protein